MTDGTQTLRAQTYRLGIAVFPQPDSVWPAVVALLDGGIRLHQLCLAASPRTLALLPASAHPYRTRQPELDRLLDHVSSTHAHAPDAQERLIVRFDRSGDADGEAQAGQADWTRPELCSNVLEQLVVDAVVLGVSSETNRQQFVSTRILLEYSSQRVLTQEFVLPGHH